MIDRKKLDEAFECKSLAEKAHFLSARLGLKAADVRREAALLIGTYEQDDVVNLSQEEFDNLMRQIAEQRATG